MSSTTIIRAVLRECEDKLVDEWLVSDKVVDDLKLRGFLSDENKKAILFEKSKTVQCQKLLRVLQDSSNDEILDTLIEHLRQEGTYPHLWALLEYSKAKQRKIRSRLQSLSEGHHT